jgi:hypothetical protein
MNNTDLKHGLLNFSKLMFKRITKNGRSEFDTDFIPGWMARSKHLKRSEEEVNENKFARNWKFKRKADENKFIRKWKFKKKFAVKKFERRWKFKKLRKSDMKNKFKMKDLLCMTNDTLNPTSSEGINEKISTATEEQ